jgi:two-component system, probable response regulator PhcQ
MEQFKILLVDDSPNVLNALIRVFKDEGYNIFTATSSKAGLEILKNERIDLIISDENMPEMPGTEFLRVASVQYPQTIRIMLTGLFDLELAKNAINKGEVYKFFNKPWDDFELLISVRYALKQKMLETKYIKLKNVVAAQSKILNALEMEYPGISQKELSEDGAVIIEDNQE